MVIVQLTSDNRESFREYHKPIPWFGTAPDALLQGFAALPQDAEVHVVSCIQQPVSSPAKLADNIWFHSLHVPKLGWMRTGYQGCVRAVRRKLKELRPDIVHGQGTERDCAISAVFSGFPNVLTVHGNMNAIARLHHSPIGTFHWLAARFEEELQLGSFCTVFTGTEVLGLIRQGKRPADLARAAYRSVVKRVLEMERVEGRIVATGGVVAHHPMVVELLEKAAGAPVLVPEHPQEIGALGVALAAREAATSAAA